MATFTDPVAFAKHVSDYGHKIQRANPLALEAEMKAIAIVVKQAGSRFHIKGRTGKKWTLGAKTEGPYGAGDDWIGYVKADPAGFWAMIEHGSYKKPGGYDIYPRRRGGKKALTTGVVTERSPAGLFAKVHHPGFGSIGHPWATAMAQAKIIGPRVYERALVSSVFGKAA